MDDERFTWFTGGRLAYESPDGVLAGLHAYEGLRFATEARDERVVPPATRSRRRASCSRRASIGRETRRTPAAAP